MVLNVHRNQPHHVTAFSYWFIPGGSTSCDSIVILIPVDFNVGPKNYTMWSCFKLVTGSDRQGHVASLPSSCLSLSAALGPKTAVFDYCVVILMLVQNWHLKTSQECFTTATYWLFSVFKLTHCAEIVCNFVWVTVALLSAFGISTGVVTVLFSCWHGWCHVKLLLSWCTFCLHPTALQQFTVSLYSKPHQTCIMTMITLLYSCWFSVGHHTYIMTVITSSCWFRPAVLGTCIMTVSTSLYWFRPAVLYIRPAS